MVLAVAGLFAFPATADDEALEQFVDAFVCQAIDRLNAVAAMEGSAEERFVYISPRDALGKYVACFFVADLSLQCEAASGYDGLGARVGEDALPKLAALGFELDGVRGNHSLMLDLTGPDDMPAVATLMLAALHVGYDVQAEERIIIATPGESGDGPCSPGS